jgi:polyferredoxin
MVAEVPAPPIQPKPKKKLTRRAGKDRSQALRRCVQAAFLLLNIWIGIEFYLFVRHYETGGQTTWAARPPGVEGWLPIASLMNLKAFLLTGHVPGTHAAGMFLLMAFLGISWAFRKSFCSWLCPVGTISEWLWRMGRDTFKRNWALPRWLDIPLRSLKYVLLGLFLYAVGSMSVIGIRQFLDSPYGVVADVKMMDFFRSMGVATAVTLGILVLLSVFIQNFWCRYLCPYGAMVGLAALASPLRIRREPAVCIDCAKCAKACPSQLKVDQLVTIRSAECTGCLECVAVCPAEGALMMAAPRRRRVPAWAMAAGMGAIFFGLVGYAQWAGYWQTNIPSSVYFEHIPRASEFNHP